MKLRAQHAALSAALFISAAGLGVLSGEAAPNAGGSAELWALQPIRRPLLPRPDSAGWERGAIDTFVIARLRASGCEPAPAANRRTLARRLSFDLLGLPPDPGLVDSFVSDRRPNAYERLVDRLLASPRFGERMAQHWLDLARYADSDGYHDDTMRAMWPYRDWVIGAFNSNQSFADFTIEQLAGDLLPKATLFQQVASAFHRNGPTSSEDGANPDEYMARYAVDRVNTTATVWLGLTAQCAECHDHKYDPLTTREYYQLFAFFNQTPENPLFRGLHAPPVITVPSVHQAAELARLREEIRQRQLKLEAIDRRLAADQQAWERRFSRIRSREFGRQALVAEFTFEGHGAECLSSTGLRRTSARIVPGVDGTRPSSEPGLVDNAYRLSGSGDGLDLGTRIEFRRSTGFTFGAWVKFSEQGGCLVSKISSPPDLRGVDLSVVAGRATFRVIHRWPDAAIKVTTTARYPANRWLHLMVTYDGSPDPRGIYIYFNGQSQELVVNHHSDLKGTIQNLAPVLVGSRPGGQEPFQGLVDDVQFYRWPLSFRDLTGVLYGKLDGIVRLPRQERSAEQKEFLRTFFRQHVHGPHRRARSALVAVSTAEKKLTESIPKLRVMQDGAIYRETHVLIRGDFRRQGPPVTPDTPAWLPPLPPKSDLADRYTRLDLAKWLIAPAHPLTARVAVNRWWGMIFGRGIVATPDDFGTRGSPPTHPELLDWLAEELIRSDWDVKALLRRLVTSSAYRQSSVCTPVARRRDPNNVLLTRGPRRRLAAEQIRDNVLAISGLLSGRIGGPSVRPYQPPGLWRDLSQGDEQAKSYVQSHGEDLYRRGLYTVWKRSIHYPAFALFDAPSRELCTAVRPITNTPLQALVLLNDLTFVEAARVFAEKILSESSPTFESRLNFAFQRALSRPASAEETRAMLRLHRDMMNSFTQSPDAARQLAQSGEYRVDRSHEVVLRAAWTAMAQIILNLDETLNTE